MVRSYPCRTTVSTPPCRLAGAAVRRAVSRRAESRSAESRRAARLPCARGRPRSGQRRSGGRAGDWLPVRELACVRAEAGTGSGGSRATGLRAHRAGRRAGASRRGAAARRVHPAILGFTPERTPLMEPAGEQQPRHRHQQAVARYRGALHGSCHKSPQMLRRGPRNADSNSHGTESNGKDRAAPRPGRPGRSSCERAGARVC